MELLTDIVFPLKDKDGIKHRHRLLKQRSLKIEEQAWGEIHQESYWWTWLCEMFHKEIYSTFKRAAGEAEGEINSNEGRSASWADEVYYYLPPSAAAADDCGDTDEDKMTTRINQQRHAGASGTCQLSQTVINTFIYRNGVNKD